MRTSFGNTKGAVVYSGATVHRFDHPPYTPVLYFLSDCKSGISMLTRLEKPLLRA